MADTQIRQPLTRPAVQHQLSWKGSGRDGSGVDGRYIITVERADLPDSQRQRRLSTVVVTRDQQRQIVHPYRPRVYQQITWSQPLQQAVGQLSLEILVQMACGIHVHTLIIDEDDRLFVCVDKSDTECGMGR